MTLEILRSDLLGGARHGFFTRRGGASSGIYAGLNCGPGSKDQREAVVVNRGRVAAALEVTPEKLLSLHQVHSTDVVVAGPEGWDERPRADAAVSTTPGVRCTDHPGLGVEEEDRGAVGGQDAERHAGWRGALEGVLEAVLDAMEDLGARTSATHAVVGPTISQRAYEVGPEFFDRFRDEDPDFTRFFASGQGDRMLSLIHI